MSETNEGHPGAVRDVEVRLGRQGQVWINVNGICAWRAPYAGVVIIVDDGHPNLELPKKEDE